MATKKQSSPLNDTNVSVSKSTYVSFDHKALRTYVRDIVGSSGTAKSFVQNNIGIDVTRDGKFKVRPEEKTPSCVINKDGSFHDYGSGEHYSDVISLLFDGYKAFDSLFETIKYVCQELNIDMEAYHE